MRTANKNNDQRKNHQYASIHECNKRHIYITLKEKLGYGVLDIQLDNEIEQTEKHLAMLNRQKELRNQEYGWDDIYSIIQGENNLENIYNHQSDIKNQRIVQQFRGYNNPISEDDLN